MSGTWATVDAAVPGAARSFLGRRWAFGLSVGLLAVFSQGWVPFLLGPDGDPEASGLIRAVYFPWYAAALLLVAADPRQSLRAALRAPLIWALIALAFVSTTWSIDPGVTLRRTIALLFTTLAGFAIAARYDWPELAEVMGAAYALIAIASLVVGLLLPSYGRMSDIFPGSWRGVFFDKNGLGDGMTLGFMAFIASAALVPRRRRLWLGFAGLALLLVLLSQSKTSLVSLLIGLSAFVLVLVARRSAILAVVTTFLGVVVVGLFLALIAFDADALLGLLGKDATLTGRTEIWAAILRQIHTRPWTGFGYGAVWTDESGWGPLAWIISDAKFRPHHAHNGWLETWLGLGYVGLWLWAAVFGQTLALAIAAIYRSRAAYLALPALVVYGLISLTESVTFVYNDLVWVIFTALSVRLALPVKGAGGADRFASAAP